MHLASLGSPNRALKIEVLRARAICLSPSSTPSNYLISRTRLSMRVYQTEQKHESLVIPPTFQCPEPLNHHLSPSFTFGNDGRARQSPHEIATGPDLTDEGSNQPKLVVPLFRRLDVTPDGPAALPHHYGPSDLHLIAAFLSEGGRAYSRLHSALLARVQEAGLEALLEPPPPPPVEMAAPAKLLGEADKALALPGAVSAAEESRIGDAKTGEQGTALRRDRSDDRSEATEAADIGMTSAEAQAGAGSGPHAELVLKPVQNPSTIPVKPAVSPQSLAAPPFEPPASPPANPPPNPSANTPVNHFASPPLNATAAPGVSPAANAAPNPAVQPPPNPPANLAPNPSSNSVLNPVPSSQSDDRSTPSGVAKETEPTPLPTETQASPSFEGPSVKASGIAVDKRGVEVASAEGSDTVSIAAVPEAGQGAENGRKEGPNPVAGCVSDVRFPSENESGEKSGPRVAKSGPSDGPQGPTESKPEAGRADKKVAAQGIPDETPTSEVRAEGDIKIGSAATIAESVPPPVTEVAGGPEDFVRDGPAMGGSVPLGEASKGEKSSETAAEKEVPESVSGSAKLVEADMAAKKGEGAPVDSAEEPGAAGSAGTTAADVSETQDLAVLHAQTSLTPADEKGGLSEAPVSKVFPSDRIRDAAVQGGTPLAGSVAKRPEEGAAAVSARPGGVASTQTGLPGDTPGAGPGDAPNQVPGEGLGLAGSGDAAVSPNRVTIGGLGSSGLVENGGGSAIQTQLATGDLAGLGLAGLGLSGSGTGSVSLEGLAPAGVSETEPLTCHEPLLFDFDNIEDLVEKLAREQGYLVDTGPLEPAHALTESRGPVGTDVANGPAKQQLIISAPQQIGNETVAATGGLVGSSNGAPSGGLLTTESATRPEQGPSKRQKLDAPLTVADGVSGIQKPPFSLPAGTLAPPHPQPFIPPLNGLRPAVHSQQLQVPLQISNRALAPVQGVPFAVPNHPPALQTLSVRPPVPSQQLGAGTNTPPSHPVLTSAGLAAALRPPAPKLRWPFDDVNQSSARPAPPPATPHTPAAAKGPVSTPAQRPPAGKPLSGMSAAAQTGPVSGGLVLTKGRQAQLAKAGTSSAAAATTGPSVAPIIIKSLKPFERYENRYADGAVAAEAAEKLTAGEKKEAASGEHIKFLIYIYLVYLVLCSHDRDSALLKVFNVNCCQRKLWRSSCSVALGVLLRRVHGF